MISSDTARLQQNVARFYLLQWFTNAQFHLVVYTLVLESRFVFILGFLFIALQSVASGLFAPLLADYINARIPSSKRATVLSIKNMVNSVLFMTLSPLLGRLVDLYALPSALLLMGAILVVTSLVFLALYRDKTLAADVGP